MQVGKRVGTDTARVQEIFRRRPAVAQSRKSAAARLVGDGWRVEVQLGAHTLIVDQPEAVGGDDAGPNPGDLVRGALAACLAQNYAMNAWRFDVELHEVRIEVESDIDLGLAWGNDTGQPAGFSAVRYTATLATDASPERVRALMAYVEEHSPSLDDLRRALPIAGELVLNPASTAPHPA